MHAAMLTWKKDFIPAKKKNYITPTTSFYHNIFESYDVRCIGHIWNLSTLLVYSYCFSIAYNLKGNNIFYKFNISVLGMSLKFV